jgi:hypothetical protein
MTLYNLALFGLVSLVVWPLFGRWRWLVLGIGAWIEWWVFNG